MALSDVEIRNAKPSERPRKLFDGNGLHVVITPSGGKLWRLAYRFDGKERTLSIGGYPAIGLAEARKRRDEAKALLASGVDPSQQKRRDKVERAIAASNTFQTVAEELIAKMRREGRAAATLAKTEWLLGMAYPALGSRPIGEIKAPEILAVLRKLEARGTLESAHRLRSMIGSVFRYGIVTGRAEGDPSAHLKGALTMPRPTNRAAILDPIAFGGLLRAIETFDGQPSTRAALRLLPHVFVRPGELRHAEWAEFSFEEARWIIPSGRMKMRKEHHVPLSRQALEILAELRPVTGRGRFLFPGNRSVLRVISENTINAALRRLGYTQQQMSAHGFRASASTLLNESGKFSPDANERALAHQDRDEIRRAYHRGSHWQERVEMAQWWSDYIDGLRDGGKVLEFRRAGERGD